MCVSQKHLKLHSFPLTSAAWSESEVAGRPTEHNCSCLCKVKSDGFSKPPPTPASSTPSLSLSFSLCSLDHVQMFPAKTTLQKFTKREQERAASCRPGGSGDVAGRGRPATSAGQGGGGPQSGPSPLPPPRPGAGPWEDTVWGHKALRTAPLPRCQGPGHTGGPGEAVARERAGQTFRTRLWAQTGLLGLPAPRLRHAATGKPRLHAEPLLPCNRARVGSFR